MEIGDLVVRTYGEGQRPMGLIVGWKNPEIWVNTPMVKWLGTGHVTEFSGKHLEVINASR